ncbi:MAG: isocitrate/isopropylmalate dehydrogenase family protein [Jatrophihabitans sp.]
MNGSITVIPGDGVGPEVIEQALMVIEATGVGLQFAVFDDINADRYLATGVAMSQQEFEAVRASDSVLFGAIGDPRVRSTDYARSVLLRMRNELGLYVNLRPARLADDRLNPLRDAHRRIDCLIVRENSEGLYGGIGGLLRSGTGDELAIDTDISTYLGVSRIIDYAFSIARQKVCMVDKSNAVPHGGTLWQRCWAEACAKHPDLITSHLYVDAAAMRLVTDPESFEVIVTNNSYGDILSDLAGVLAGGIGTCGSANLNPLTGFGLYEPVHGSAPDIAGRGVANPIGAILSAAMMLDTLGWPAEAAAISAAVKRCIANGSVTADLGGSLGTREAGLAVRAGLG